MQSFTAPILVKGTRFSKVLLLWEGAATVLYNSVGTSQGSRKVTLYLPHLKHSITFDASHVYIDLPDYEAPDGWMAYGFEFIDATHSMVHKVIFSFRPKRDRITGFEVRTSPVNSFSGRCAK